MTSRQRPKRPKIDPRASQERLFFVFVFDSVFGTIFDPFWLPKCLPFGTLLATKIDQKSDQKSFRSWTGENVAPRSPQDRPRAPQDAPRAPPGRPGTPQETPGTPPRLSRTLSQGAPSQGPSLKELLFKDPLLRSSFSRTLS